jgi:hypothetical protein
MTFLFMVNLFSHEAITKPSTTHLNQQHEKCWLHLQIELHQLLVPINICTRQSRFGYVALLKSSKRPYTEPIETWQLHS